MNELSEAVSKADSYKELFDGNLFTDADFLKNVVKVNGATRMAKIARTSLEETVMLLKKINEPSFSSSVSENNLMQHISLNDAQLLQSNVPMEGEKAKCCSDIIYNNLRFYLQTHWFEYFNKAFYGTDAFDNYCYYKGSVQLFRDVEKIIYKDLAKLLPDRTQKEQLRKSVYSYLNEALEKYHNEKIRLYGGEV